MDFKNKVAVVTGGANGIGKCICEEFKKAGASVCIIDLCENEYFQGNLADKTVLETFAEKVIADYGHIDYLINNAAPLNRGIDDAAYENYKYDEASVSSYAEILNRVAEKLEGKVNMYFLPIPTAIGIVLPDNMIPVMGEYYQDQHQRMGLVFDKLDDSIIKIDCFDNLMQHRDEYLYFRTDFHWNGKAAYYAYETWCKTKGLTPYTLDQRELSTFDGFKGGLYQGDCKKDPALREDTVEAYHPYSKNVTMVFTDKKGVETKWPVINDVSGWAASAKYNAFAGSDNPITVFTNPDVTDGSVGVVIKESFGNALMPYLCDHYSTLYEIDYRYWQGNIVDFCLQVGADDVTFANNMGMIRAAVLVAMLADNV